ncbi:MAG: tetratricopeptide repeat protein [Deltaproteobacteria bacterium]|nr:MAG: tetratricopeptide repeat protein [Deltaproteobacteria bacterium]
MDKSFKAGNQILCRFFVLTTEWGKKDVFPLPGRDGEMPEPDVTDPLPESRESSRITLLLLAIILLYIGFRAVICLVRDDRRLVSEPLRSPPDCPEAGVNYRFDDWVEDFAFHLGMGEAYARAGYFDPAILEYRQALRLAPRHAGAHAQLARIYGNLGLYEEAMAELKAAIRHDPSGTATREAIREVYEKRIEAALTPEEQERLRAESAKLLGEPLPAPHP